MNLCTTKYKSISTDRNINKLIIGKLGRASKSITFRPNEFKKELAPINSKIEYREINGEKFVTITY